MSKPARAHEDGSQRYIEHRLARPGDDFEATEPQRLVEGALVQATRPEGPWRWPAADRRVRRRRA